MAKIAPKGKKVTGTKKKDKIVWQSKTAWKKALTVNAGAGNDAINFSKSAYKNTLNGQKGNDSILGGKKNDIITGGTGNDIIKTGKGTNTVVINKGDGNDTVYHQGKKTVVQLKTYNKKDKVAFTKNGKDLIMTYTHLKTSKDKKAVAEKVTFKNYFDKNGNVVSAQNTIYLQNALGNTKAVKLSSLIKTKGVTLSSTKKATLIGTVFNDTITGSKYNDIIVAGKGNDSVNGGKGNDVIKGYEGKNTLIGGAGDDSIMGGTGNDYIIGTSGKNTLLGGKGNDTIKGGTGNDSIYGGDGKDIIYANGGNNTIYGGNDNDTIYSGTGYTIIYGDAGNDVIHDKGNDRAHIHVGAGNDTISLDSNNPFNEIYFENGDGNNVLKGLRDETDTNSWITLVSDDLFHRINLTESLSYDYILGTSDENNLILALTGGENFTIENYYGVNDDIKNTITTAHTKNGVMYSGQYLSEQLIFPGNIENMEEYKVDENEYYIGSFGYKLIIADEPDSSISRNISINSANRDIVIKGKDDDLDIRGSNNNVYWGGGSFGISLGDELTGNSIYIDATSTGSLLTSDGGSTYVDSSNTSSISINSYGSDYFNLKKGRHYIYFNKNYDKTVTMNAETEEVQIEGVEIAKSTTITQNMEETPTDIMFEHYASWKDSYNKDYLSVIYMGEDGAILNGKNNKELLIKGKWTDGVFNLDNTTVGNKVTVTAYPVTKTLSEMTQYADMTNSSLNKLFKFADKTQNGLLDNRAGVYIKGSDSQDYYSGYTFANGKVTINDAGGRGGLNDDILRLDMARNNYRFFIDIDTEGNTASNDMFIFKFTNEPYSQEFAQYDGLFQYLYGNEDNIDAYIKIENSIEATNNIGVPGTWYLPDGQIECINDNTKTGFNLQQYFYSINMDVAGWLNDYNDNYGTECNSISAAIKDGKAESTELVNLYHIYSDNTNWANY